MIKEFLNKLLKHAKIPSRERKRFFLCIIEENARERIVNMDEDLNLMVKQL